MDPYNPNDALAVIVAKALLNSYQTRFPGFEPIVHLAIEAGYSREKVVELISIAIYAGVALANNPNYLSEVLLNDMIQVIDYLIEESKHAADSAIPLDG